MFFGTSHMSPEKLEQLRLLHLLKKTSNLVEIGVSFETVSVHQHSDAQPGLASFIGNIPSSEYSCCTIH